jgi:hypothetical protein
VRNREGNNPWVTVEDVTFTNNIVRHTASGINILEQDYSPPSQVARNIRVHNNLFYDVDGYRWNGHGIWVLFNEPGGVNFAFTHNTMEAGGSSGRGVGFEHPSVEHAARVSGLVLNDNIFNAHVIGGPNGFVGTEALDYHAGTTWDFRRNALVGNTQAYPYPTDNPPAAANYDSVGFVDRAGGNYRLAPNSPYMRRVSAWNIGTVRRGSPCRAGR